MLPLYPALGAQVRKCAIAIDLLRDHGCNIIRVYSDDIVRVFIRVCSRKSLLLEYYGECTLEMLL